MAKNRGKRMSQTDSNGKQADGQQVTDPAKTVDEVVAQDTAVQDVVQDESAEGVAPQTENDSGQAAEGAGEQPTDQVEEVVAKQPETTVIDATIPAIPAPAPVQPVEVQAEPVAAREEEFCETPEKSKRLSDEEKYIEQIRATGTVEQKSILAAVESFFEKMDPKKPANEAQIVDAQFQFLTALRWILSKEYNAFRPAWNVLLVFFSIHHGRPTQADYSALSEYSTNRCLAGWTKGSDVCNAYRNLVTLLRTTRNSATRRHDVKTLSIPLLAPSVLTADQLENLQKFYQG